MMKVYKLLVILFASVLLLNASNSPSYAAQIPHGAEEALKAADPAGRINVKLTVLLEGGDIANEKRNNDALNKLEGYMARELRDLKDIEIVKKNADVEIIVTALFTFRFEPDANSSFIAVSITAHNMYCSNRFGWVDPCCPDKAEAEACKNTIGAIEYQKLKSFAVSNMKKALEGTGLELDLKCFKKVREQKGEQEKKRIVEMRRVEAERIKKQKQLEEEARIKNIISWKQERYNEWKSNKSMSILDEDLEKMGITFEQLLKEFRDMEKARKDKEEAETPLQ